MFPYTLTICLQSSFFESRMSNESPCPMVGSSFYHIRSALG